MRTSAVFFLLLAPCLPGCIAAAGIATATAVMGSTVESQSHGQVQGRTARVWASTKFTLSKMSQLPLAIDDDLMTAQATIDNHKVNVLVRTYDLERTEIFVEALQLGIPSPKMSAEVLSQIMNDIADG